MNLRRRATSLLLLCVLVAARATVVIGTERLDTRAITEKLIAQGSPDALATAALLKQFGSESDTGAYALAAQALQGAPRRAELAWLAVRLCDGAEDCNPEADERRLRELDPANAAGWVGPLGRAQRGNDVPAIDDTLASLGRAQHFNVYFEPLVVVTARQLIGVTVATPDAQPRVRAALTMHAIGLVAAAILPGSKIFAYSCHGFALQIAGRLERCRGAARTLEKSDAYVVEGLGLSLQQQLWPLQSQEGRTIGARRRVFQYRLEAFSKLDVSTSDPAAFPADYLQIAAQHEREQDVALVYFERNHVPIDPPPAWKSTQPPRFP